MPNNEYKNLVAKVPYDTYVKLRFVADTMRITLPDLMGRILNNDFFVKAVNDMFEMVSQTTNANNK